MKKHVILPFAAICMGLENIIVSKVSHRKTNMISHHLYIESKR